MKFFQKYIKIIPLAFGCKTNEIKQNLNEYYKINKVINYKYKDKQFDK